MFLFKFTKWRKTWKCHFSLCNNLSIFNKSSSDSTKKPLGKCANCGFSATLVATTEQECPVEFSWLCTHSTLKLLLQVTKTGDESLQDLLLLHNLQNIWFSAVLYSSHGKSFNQLCTNFRLDVFSSASLSPFKLCPKTPYVILSRDKIRYP